MQINSRRCYRSRNCSSSKKVSFYYENTGFSPGDGIYYSTKLMEEVATVHLRFDYYFQKFEAVNY